jgi:hypothetical protein
MTTAVIHQPNYLPGLTYFDKIASADVFISLDTVQFIKRNWINRNRFKTADGPLWLTVPVQTKGRYTQSILETEIDTERDWVHQHRGTIESAYRRAAHFDRYAPAFFAELAKPWVRLAEMNESLLRLCLAWLGVTTPFLHAGDLDVAGSGTDLLINLCRAAGADTYLAGPGGRKYMDLDDFAAAGIQVRFHDYRHPEYRQLHGAFEPDLSIVDLLLNEGPAGLDILRSGSRLVHA